MALMTYGIVFQEYFYRTPSGGGRAKLLRMLWVAASLVLTMSYASNLKASLIRRETLPRTETLRGMIERDLVVHTSRNFYSWLSFTPSPLHDALVAQVDKHDSVYPMT